jgi:hypothetical protein
MLIDTVPFNNLDQTRSLRGVLRRRIEYLAARAEAVSERHPDILNPLWRPALGQATLWMEATEGAMALGEPNEAREYLRRATKLLLELGLPLGAALQRAFLTKDRDLAVLTRRALQPWRESLTASNGTAIEGTEAGQQPFAELGTIARQTSQQWAYFALAEADADGDRGEPNLSGDALKQRLERVAAAPVGRLRLPLRDYSKIAEVSAGTVVGYPGVSEQQRRVAAETIAKSLVGLYRSLQSASGNTYLWNRMLAPGALFDLDTAVLIEHIQRVERLLKAPSLLEQVYKLVSDDAQAYAGEFIDAVRSLAQGGAGQPDH